MECAAIGILALSGVVAIAAMLALAFGGYVVSALDSAFSKWQRLGFLGRILTAAMVVVATVEAQKSGMGDSNRVERVDRVDGGGGDFSRKEHKESVGVELGVEVEQRTDKPSSVQLGPEASTITSTHRLASVKTNDTYSYSMPENAVRYPNWWMRGGYEDVFKLELGDFRFPIGTNIVDYLWVYTWGKVRPRLKAKELEIAAVGAPMSAAPQVSEFWYMDGTNSSKILTWHNFFLGRIPIDQSSSNSVSSVYSVVSISLQLELFPNGDYIARSNLVERYYKRVNPDDWDDDGIPNDADVNPSESDGDFFGPQEDELPEGAEASNYCWVDIVVSNANSLVTFVGDKPSNLPDPCFIAKAGTTHRVNLLIGKTYRVSSALPVFCMAKSSDEIYVSGEGTKEMTVVYPVSYEILDNARSVSRQVRMIPPLVGTFNWGTTNRCCDIGNVSGTWIPSCSSGCICEGCTSGGFTFNYEGYSLSFDGMECGCDPATGDEEEFQRVNVSFSHKVLFYEEAYTNAPGEVVARRNSTNVIVRVEVNGGQHGGLLNLTRTGFDKLMFMSGDELPENSITLAPHEARIWDAVYAPLTHSGEKNDIVVAAQFEEHMTGEVLEDEERLTVVKLILTPLETRAGCENRHIVGVREVIECVALPDIGMLSEIGDGRIEMGSYYVAPLTSDYNVLSYVVNDLSYTFNLMIVEPSAIIARLPEAYDFGLSDNIAGGAGMKFDIYILPETVSFARISMEEVPSLEGTHTGYFANVFFTNVWYHTVEMKAGQWINIKPGNYWSKDSAVMGDILPLEKPNGDMTYDVTEGAWSDGELIWHIRWGWRDRNAETGDVPVKSMPVRYDQTFRIDQEGTLSVLKFGHIVSRGTNDAIRLNGTIVDKE